MTSNGSALSGQQRALTGPDPERPQVCTLEGYHAWSIGAELLLVPLQRLL